MNRLASRAYRALISGVGAAVLLALGACAAPEGSGPTYGNTPVGVSGTKQNAISSDSITVTNIEIGPSRCPAKDDPWLIGLFAIRTHDQLLSDYKLLGANLKGMTAATPADWEFSAGTIYLSVPGINGVNSRPWRWNWHVILVHNVVIGADARHAVIQAFAEPDGTQVVRVICIDQDANNNNGGIVVNKLATPNSPARQLAFLTDSTQFVEYRQKAGNDNTSTGKLPTNDPNDARWADAKAFASVAECMRYNDTLVTNPNSTAPRGSNN